MVRICGSHYISIGQHCSRGNGEVRKYERLGHFKRNWVNLGHFQLWLQVGLSDWTNFSRCFLLLGGVEIVKKKDSVLENEEATFSWLVGWGIEPFVFVLKWRDWRTQGHLGSWRHLKIEYSLGRWWVQCYRKYSEIPIPTEGLKTQCTQFYSWVFHSWLFWYKS